MDTEELRKKIETKYNICLDIEDKLGEKTYWELREYFTKEIELDNIIVNTDLVHICCHRTDIESIKKDFNEQMKEFIENDPGQCSDPYGVGCSSLENSNTENNNSPPPPPPYK
tara:strand:- start:119 stop:457 length:339 start_codon:yes stop_codon:yes gene_type:complete